MQVQMRTHELDMHYQVYKYDEDTKQVINATGQPNALALQEYDSVITSRNVNTPIILEFMITGMDLGENIPLHINTHCENSSPTAQVLSNIVQFQFATINSIETTATANEIYEQSVSYFEDYSIPEVTFKNGNNKVLDVLYTLNNYESAILNGSLRIYIKIDYSATLIEDFSDTISIIDSTTTSFANDLTLINCYTDEN